MFQISKRTELGDMAVCIAVCPTSCFALDDVHCQRRLTDVGPDLSIRNGMKIFCSRTAHFGFAGFVLQSLGQTFLLRSPDCKDSQLCQLVSAFSLARFGMGDVICHKVCSLGCLAAVSVWRQCDIYHFSHEVIDWTGVW